MKLLPIRHQLQSKVVQCIRAAARQDKSCTFFSFLQISFPHGTLDLIIYIQAGMLTSYATITICAFPKPNCHPGEWWGSEHDFFLFAKLDNTIVTQLFYDAATHFKHVISQILIVREECNQPEILRNPNNGSFER